MKSVGVIGFGYVGKAMDKFFRDHYNVIIHDPAFTDSDGNGLSSDRETINRCDFSIVAVPTPQAGNGRCDTSIVESVIDWVDTPLIIIKSTVEPGTTERLKKKTGKHIIFCPEYAGESSYWSPYKFDKDVKETPFFIFGGDPEDTKKAVNLYMPIVGPTKIYRQTDSRSAEMAKYVENSFYAAKIAFCYEVANICEKAGLDYNEVRELWLLDPRLNPMHTAVFDENDRAFGGRCLPKDLSALTKYAQCELEYPASLLQQVIDSNEEIGKYRAEKRNNSKK